jgi:hypothetical protein
MTRETPKELLDKGFITAEQFDRIDLITSGKIVSLFYELRSLLYLGVMLFTAGVGLLIYQNIGEFGHIVAIIALTVLMIACFWYGFRNRTAYSNSAIQSATPYFDYVVLLGCLLFVSIQGYLQFRFGWLTENLGASTLISALVFFYVAYRFDHVGVLSLAITALASFWSISLSPQKWYSGNFFEGPHLHSTAVVFSMSVGAIAFFLDRKAIKTHFTFTYLNFCMLLFFIGSIVGLFSDRLNLVYIPLIFGGSAFAWYMARWKRSFLFLLYAFVASYIALTYFLAINSIFSDVAGWAWYSILSCGGFIYFIIKGRKFFTQKP